MELVWRFTSNENLFVVYLHTGFSSHFSGMVAKMLAGVFVSMCHTCPQSNPGLDPPWWYLEASMTQWHNLYWHRGPSCPSELQVLWALEGDHLCRKRRVNYVNLGLHNGVRHPAIPACLTWHRHKSTVFCGASFSDHAECVKTLVIFIQVRQSQGGNSSARLDLHPFRIKQTCLWKREIIMHNYSKLL